MKYKSSMLEYCMKVLQAMSFDRKLFQKEYLKSLNWLSVEEGRQLEHWVRNNGPSK